MEHNKLNQKETKIQRLHPNGLPITLDMDEPGGPIKDIEPIYSKEFDKIFKKFFPALFQKEEHHGK